MQLLKQSFNRLDLRKNWPGYLMIAPAIIAILALSLYPLLRGITLSFTNYNLVRPTSKIFDTFAGFRNYERIFTDEKFILSLKNTLNWTLVNLVAQLLFAMLLALALNKSMRGRSFFRTMTLVPWAVPPFHCRHDLHFSIQCKCRHREYSGR